jgi:hypothetical protein
MQYSNNQQLTVLPKKWHVHCHGLYRNQTATWLRRGIAEAKKSGIAI